MALVFLGALHPLFQEIRMAFRFPDLRLCRPLTGCGHGRFQHDRHHCANVFHKIHVDPAVASGPLITTVNDLVAVVTYYGLAMVFLIDVSIFDKSLLMVYISS